MIATAGALATLLALGVWERRQRDRARAAVPVRVHVNGTRGKSTVTRAIAAGLRAGGQRTMAKTTGTAARLIGFDGQESAVPRRGPANIREQLWFMREARRAGAEALVVECMAIAPDLQVVSEHNMIGATIGVITNARPDHADVMGETHEAVAAALAGTIPERGLLVVGPDLDLSLFVDTAKALGTSVHRADVDTLPEDTSAPSAPGWARANLATALAVTRALGVPDDVAYPAMLASAPDPGQVTRCGVVRRNRQVTVVDASAANDPTSLALLLAGDGPGDRVFVFNHRADRPLRLRQFAASPPWRTTDRVVVTGDRPDRGTRLRVNAGRTVGLSFVTTARIADALAGVVDHTSDLDTIVFCGNTRGLDVRRIVTDLGTPWGA